MGSIFSALHTGYSGLKSSQTAVNVTSHNIANSANENYTRQRAVITNAVPLNIQPGDLGLGSQVSQIVRIHDEFVFQRYIGASNQQSNSEYKQEVFNTLNTYFPEIAEVGIHKDLKNYFNSWQALSAHPDDGAIKADLATYTQTLTNSIQTTRDKVQSLQDNVNKEIETTVHEINRLGKAIANLNEKINTNEAGGLDNANDLRDQRDSLEKALSELVNISVTKTNLSSAQEINPNIVDGDTNYTLNIGGFNIVDRDGFHELTLDGSNNPSGYFEISYKRKDWVEFPMEDVIKGGKLGAMLDMRGREYEPSKGAFLDGEIQKVIDGLDQFAETLIESTNNIYAQAPQTNMKSSVTLEENYSVLNSDLNVNEGSFTINIYNNNGEIVSSKEIDINVATIINGGTNSIVAKINNDTDDNSDGNSNNDIDDFITAGFKNGALTLDMDDSFIASGYTFSITESDAQNPTNFAGALGLSRFFEGSDATDIRLKRELREKPSTIQAGVTPNSGDKDLANAMQQLQYDKVNFYSRNTQNDVVANETLERFFTMVAGGVASKSADINAVHDSNKALFNAIKSEYDSISKVSIDEEMTNLIKFQTGYQAASKVITTVDQMINTLLQIKQ
jgi:flagellar hook-associated protein 1 FlgK